MAEELDVEAMLEAPYKRKDEDMYDNSSSSRKEKSKKDSRHRSKDRSHDRSKDKKRERRSRSRGRRSRSRGRRSRSRDRRSRSRSRDRRHRERIHRRSRSRDRDLDHGRPRRSRSPRRRRSISPLREKLSELTPEERDVRTVFCMQLSARIRPRDLEEFFSSVGKVRDVRLIADNKTRRSKGICYVEFADIESVPLAIGLSGQKLLGVPIIVQPSQAEKNRLQAASAQAPTKSVEGPLRLYIGSLHFNINEDMLRGIFEPFGRITDLKVMRDHESQRSLGFGFISFSTAEDAKKAMEQLNGFELAGRPMKVGNVTDRGEGQGHIHHMDIDEVDRAGFDLGATGRLQLMAKLAEGTGFQIPQYAANALNSLSQTSGIPLNPFTPSPMQAGAQSNLAAVPGSGVAQVSAAPPIATQCFMLSNMFEPLTETRPRWDQEVRDDVIDECNKHGGVLHMYVDKNSPQGNVYVKCPTISAALASVNALHGRFYAGRIITAAYVPLPNYHSLFADSVRANQLVMPSSQTLSASYQTGFSAQQLR